MSRARASLMPLLTSQEACQAWTSTWTTTTLNIRGPVQFALTDSGHTSPRESDGAPSSDPDSELSNDDDSQLRYTLPTTGRTSLPSRRSSSSPDHSPSPVRRPPVSSRPNFAVATPLTDHTLAPTRGSRRPVPALGTAASSSRSHSRHGRHHISESDSCT